MYLNYKYYDVEIYKEAMDLQNLINMLSAIFNRYRVSI